MTQGAAVRVKRILPCLISATAFACGSDATQPPAPLPSSIAVELVASGLTSPVHLTAPHGDARLFVVEQPGRIRIVRNDSLLATPFLDITDRVLHGGERGLLGLAFHPDYAANGNFYVNYTAVGTGETRIERFTVSSAGAAQADPATGSVLLAVAQPFSNHNGGLLAFGPDGMLYIGMGDGGSAGDPQGHGQDTQTLLGALLRIDVDGTAPYAIPAGNPFVSGGGRPEIWAWGLRNPWRFSFDTVAGQLYIADVGQNRLEEINVVPAGSSSHNYGWNIMEGSECYASDSCSQAGLTLPVLEYDHSEGCSVTGGHVYRGSTIPGLRGHYLYSDFCRGWLRSFRFADNGATERREWDVGALGNVLSFGEDSAGELYILTAGGQVLRIVPATSAFARD
jgi:glucose/arabinose dehydrogenase